MLFRSSNTYADVETLRKMFYTALSFENTAGLSIATRADCIDEEVKPDFIKTSTGFGTGGATFDDVKLMKEHVGDAVKVKAAGGIRDAKTFMEMIECGAQRIGTSAGISIIKEFEAMMKEQGVSTLEI